MKPVGDLIKRYPDNPHLKQAVAKTGLAENELFYLPFTSQKNKSWTVLLNKKTDFVGFVPVDSFE